MAVMQMQRISICALKENRKAILEKLQALRDWCSAQCPTGIIRPVSSKIGINSIGETIPSSASLKRIRASAPCRWLELGSNIG